MVNRAPALILLAVWEGFLIMGEGLGLSGIACQRFADTAWILLAALVGIWLFLTGWAVMV